MDEGERGEDVDRGLLSRPVSRRGALVLLGGLGVVAAGCSEGRDAARAPVTATAEGPSATVTSCSAIPGETSGPFPGDGSNGPDVLAEHGVVRKDITSSFDGMRGRAEGVPFRMQFTVVDVDDGCAPMTGAAIYVWHCDRDGNYSMYQGASDANYLRGVQGLDANGVASFTSIFPACCSGRWPHVHFEVFPSVSDAVSATNTLVTSQLALPEDVCDRVYSTSGYEQSARDMGRVSLSNDMVFSDGASLQTPSMTGNVRSGYVASLVVGVSGTV